MNFMLPNDETIYIVLSYDMGSTVREKILSKYGFDKIPDGIKFVNNSIFRNTMIKRHGIDNIPEHIKDILIINEVEKDVNEILDGPLAVSHEAYAEAEQRMLGSTTDEPRIKAEPRIEQTPKYGVKLKNGDIYYPMGE